MLLFLSNIRALFLTDLQTKWLAEDVTLLILNKDALIAMLTFVKDFGPLQKDRQPPNSVC